jgi:hypothetical protein
MKKNKYDLGLATIVVILIAIVLTFSPSVYACPPDQDCTCETNDPEDPWTPPVWPSSGRNIVWVHGLGGSAESWQHYSSIFSQERQINAMRPSITNSTKQGLTIATVALTNAVYAFGSPAQSYSNNIAIGHSMGGLMIREVERTNAYTSSRWFGGYVTVTSPNYGSQISNHILDGTVYNTAMNGKSKLNAGLLSEFLNPPLFIVGLIVHVLAEIFFTNEKVQHFQGSPATNNDLKVGSTPIDNLNNFNSTLHRANILAEEISPVHWRMFSSQLTGHHEALLPIVNQIRSYYENKRQHHIAMANFPFMLPPLNIYHQNSATQWQKGRDWIDDSEIIWCGLIGSTQQVYQNYYVYCMPGESGGGGGGDPWNPTDDDLDNPYFDDVECSGHVVTRLVTIKTPSDGLLSVATQELKGVTEATGRRYYILGANHISVRNMSQCTLNGQPNDATKREFDKIFNRTDWFKTQ